MAVQEPEEHCPHLTTYVFQETGETKCTNCDLVIKSPEIDRLERMFALDDPR